MRPDPHTDAEEANASLGHRQSSLTGIAADGAHQVTLPGHNGDSAGPGGRSGAAGRTREVVNAFPMRDAVFVSHYFEAEEAFAVLSEYYDQRAYRFEIPRQEFRTVRAELAAHGYELAPVDDVERFAVAVRKYSDHPESIFGDSVAQFSVEGYNVFVMNDVRAVETAVDEGAIRLEAAPVTVRFPTAHGTGPLTVQDVSAYGN